MNSILIIEDNKEIRENTCELLELEHYKVWTAENGAKGLELIQVHSFDLILCDIIMVGMDGYEVLERIKNIPGANEIPFIFMSAKAEKLDFRRAMRMGADDYLIKPFGGGELLCMVETRLVRRSIAKRNILEEQKKNSSYFDLEQMLFSQGTNTTSIISRRIRKNDIIFNEGDKLAFVYFIRSGKVKIYKTSYSGKECILDIHQENEFLGHSTILVGEKHMESAMALENSEIKLIPYQDFLEILYDNADLLSMLVASLQKKVFITKQKMMEMAYCSARERVSKAILFVYNKYKDNNNLDMKDLPFSRINISSLAGLSVESTSRVLTDLKNDHLIDVTQGILKILSINGLSDIK